MGEIASFFLGALTLLGYIVWRMLRDPEWDDSNILNALRAVSHVTAHPGDLGKMVYVRANGTCVRAFPYIDKDEFSEVVKTRPPHDSIY